jgi:hypothetical protein
MFGTLPAYGFFARHVKGLTLDNVQVAFEKPDLRPALVCDDVRDLRINGLRSEAVNGGADVIMMTNVAGSLVSGCVAPRTDGVFLGLTGERTADIFLTGNDLSRIAHPFRFGKDVEPRTLLETANRMPTR